MRAHRGGCGRLRVARLSCRAAPASPQLSPPSCLSCCGVWAGGCPWSVTAPHLSSGPALWGSELPGGEETGSCFQVGFGGCTGGGWPLMPTARVTEVRLPGVRVQGTPGDSAPGKAQMPLDPPATELTPKVGPPTPGRSPTRPALPARSRWGGPGLSRCHWRAVRLNPRLVVKVLAQEVAGRRPPRPSPSGPHTGLALGSAGRGNMCPAGLGVRGVPLKCLNACSPKLCKRAPCHPVDTADLLNKLSPRR